MKKVLMDIVDGKNPFEALMENWHSLSYEDKDRAFDFFREAVVEESGAEAYGRIKQNAVALMLDNKYEDAVISNKVSEDMDDHVSEVLKGINEQCNTRVITFRKRCMLEAKLLAGVILNVEEDK